jgi:two-component system response regulator AtoC
MTNRQVLIVDDDPLMRDFLEALLESNGWKGAVAEAGDKAIELLNGRQFDVVVTDIKMPRVGGLEVLAAAKGREPKPYVIMMTAFPTSETAHKSGLLGADDFIEKPFEADVIEFKIKNGFKFMDLQSENRRLRDNLGLKYSIVGSSRSLEEIMELVDTVADSQATVLIQGETGTGKELVARALHDRSRRRAQPFIKINCAALPEGLLESELFGHEKGAFTGAIKRHIGKFEQADGGSLLLDEISEIKPALQAKLLRVLQEQEIGRVGGSEEIKVDVRIISTTNRNLKESIEAGDFREDLYYRLNVVPITLPPLKDRKDDIQALAQHFLRRYSSQNDKEVTEVAPDAMEKLLAYDWPGNIRELENVIERGVVMTGDSLLRAGHLLMEGSVQPGRPFIPAAGSAPGPLRDVEKAHIIKTLEAMENNRSKPADILGISIRTLRNKLHEYRAEGDDIG